MRYSLPQAFENMGHLSGAEVRVQGASAEEALARLVLAFAMLVTGGGPIARVREDRVAVAGGPGLPGTAVALLRELVFRLATAREVPTEIEVLSADERGAVASIAFGRHDPKRHAQVKAVTWHATRLEREGEEWVGQVVLDI